MEERGGEARYHGLIIFEHIVDLLQVGNEVKNEEMPALEVIPVEENRNDDVRHLRDPNGKRMFELNLSENDISKQSGGNETPENLRAILQKYGIDAKGFEDVQLDSNQKKRKRSEDEDKLK